jgi:hypothetical protein
MTKVVSHSSTVSQIIAAQQAALSCFDADITRLSRRITDLQNKDIASGLTPEEDTEKQGLEQHVKEIADIERHAILFDVVSLDSSVSVRLIISQIESANTELVRIKQQVSAISETIKSATQFITALTGALTSLAGLLTVLA